MDRKAALLYAQLRPYKALLNKTSGFIRWALNNVKKPYVACSFGKDSSVMLDIILRHNPDIPIRFASHPETRILDNYDRVIEWWVNEKAINLEEIFCDGGLVKVRHHQRIMLNEGDWDSFFVGIRTEESVGRRISLKKYGMFHRLSNGRIKISPMAWWSENDIAAYIESNNLPSLDKYHFEGYSARTTSGIPRTNIDECLKSLKNRDVCAYNKLAQLFPDVNYFT